MQPEEDILKRALGRLGQAPPELEAARERIRRNLKAGRRAIEPLPPLPDAAPPDLGALHRPFFVAGAVAAVCVLVAIGGAVRWRPEAPAAKSAPQSASKQTPESSRPITQPLPPGTGEPPAVRPRRPEPKKKLSAQSDRRPAAAELSPLQAAPVQLPPVEPPLAQARFTLMPPGEGKVILDRACGGCHRAAAVSMYHFATRAEYADVVARMIGMGAPVSEQEADVLIDYLFDNLRTKPEPPLDAPGRAILERACTTCHSLNGIEKYAYDSEGPYRELVSTMVSYGAKLSEAERATLVRYLFETYGKR